MDHIQQALLEARQVRDRCHELQVSIDNIVTILTAADDERVEREQYQGRMRGLRAVKDALT